MIKCVKEDCCYFKVYGECSSVCEKNGFKKVITNYDRIQNMSVDEIADMMRKVANCDECPANDLCESNVDCGETFKKWLESEVE